MSAIRVALGAWRRGVWLSPVASTLRSSIRCLSTSTLPDHKVLTMPKLSPTMEVGTIQQWVKSPGDQIEAGDVIAEIETDKAARSFEYNDDGFLAKVFVQEGEPDIPVGKHLCIVVENKGDIEAFANYDPSNDGVAKSEADKPAKTPKQPAMSEKKQAEPPSFPVTRPTSPTSDIEGTRILASPLARRSAADAGISLKGLSGTGPGGRVLAGDVHDALSSGTTISRDGAMQDASMHSDVAVRTYQRITAQRLTEAKQTIPHYYLTTECSIDNMLSLRAKLNSNEREDVPKISVNDFIIKACAAALRRVPQVNAEWMGTAVRMYHTADISVAVATPNGLITPIIKDADRKGVKDISAEFKTLAQKARDGKLESQEYMGGTFTVSNLGMFGVDNFAAIVQPPQSAILAIGSAVPRVVPDASSENGVTTRTVMTVTLSCDHRVFDGAVGAQWLQAFKSCMEDPVEIIL